MVRTRASGIAANHGSFLYVYDVYDLYVYDLFGRFFLPTNFVIIIETERLIRALHILGLILGKV